MDRCKEIIKKYFKTHYQNDLNSLIFCKRNSSLLWHKTNELFVKSFNPQNLEITKNSIIHEISKENFSPDQKKQFTEMVQHEFNDIKQIRSRFDLEVRMFLEKN
jgi:hypothetical protein